jgi:hypothetical protein
MPPNVHKRRLLLLGVPATLGLLISVFKWSAVSDHPLIAIGLLISYAVLSVCVSFVDKLWGELESTAVRSISLWLIAWFGRSFTRFERRYRRQVFFRHRSFMARGLRTTGTYTLDLDRVFVDITVAPLNPQLSASNPFRAPQLLGKRSLWDFIANKDPAYRCLAILGPPGSGKTTLLQHIAISLTGARRPIGRLQFHRLLPAFLYLRDHVSTISADPTLTLADLLTNVEVHEHTRPPVGWFRHKLDNGSCLVLLDGLDEVTDDARRRTLALWVEQQVRAYGSCRFLITSRPYGFKSNPLNGATVVEVQPFTPDQIRQFIQSWSLAQEVLSNNRDDRAVRLLADHRASDLLRRLFSNAALAALAVNPLLLTMIALVHRYRGVLPERRVELFSEICDVFLGHWQAAKGLSVALTSAQKRAVLQPLAFYMMTLRVREIDRDGAFSAIMAPLAGLGGTVHLDPQAFLSQVESESGLIMERSPGIYSFAHLTIQEYLAAAHVREAADASLLGNVISDGWWRETIRLYVAQGDATSIVRACLQLDAVDESRVSGAPLDRLTLAFECLAEARTIDPSIRTRLERELLTGLNSKSAEYRRMAGETLLSMRLKNLSGVTNHPHIDSSFITRAEYALCGEDTGLNDELLSISNGTNSENEARNPIVGITFCQANDFCIWMTDWARRTGIPNAIIRLPSEAEAIAVPAKRSPEGIGGPTDASDILEWVTTDEGSGGVGHLSREILGQLSFATILSGLKARGLLSSADWTHYVFSDPARYGEVAPPLDVKSLAVLARLIGPQHGGRLTRATTKSRHAPRTQALRCSQSEDQRQRINRTFAGWLSRLDEFVFFRRKRKLKSLMIECGFTHPEDMLSTLPNPASLRCCIRQLDLVTCLPIMELVQTIDRSGAVSKWLGGERVSALKDRERVCMMRAFGRAAYLCIAAERAGYSTRPGSRSIGRGKGSSSSRSVAVSPGHTLRGWYDACLEAAVGIAVIDGRVAGLIPRWESMRIVRSEAVTGDCDAS